MKQPTAKQLDAIIKLNNIDEFKVFVGWLAESRISEALLASEMDKEPQGSWMRGRVQQLRYLIEYVNKAESLLEASLRGEQRER